MHEGAAHLALVTIGCMAGGALLGMLLALIPRKSPTSVAGGALAMSAGAFFGGLALIVCYVVWLWWTLAHSHASFFSF